MIDWEAIDAQVDREFACACEAGEVRRQDCAGGVVHYKRQCLRCGALGPALAKASLTALELETAVAVDKRPAQVWNQARLDRRRQLAGEVLREQQEAGYARLDDLLASDAWKEKRVLRLEQDRHRCQARLQGCLVMASEVHHLRYDDDHFDDQPLWDLRSVCRRCHQELERRKDARKPEALRRGL